MKNNKLDKNLLNEELKKFKLMSEYAFYEDRAGDPENTEDKLILGMNEADDSEEADANAGFGEDELSDEGGLDSELGGDEEITDEEPDGFGDEADGVAEEPEGEEDVFGGDEEITDEDPEDDSVELDVTELVKGSEEAKASADAANAKIDQLMQMVSKLENATKNMDAISSKIDKLETEFEKRNPTEEEKLEMRSLSSAPYNLKLTDFWKDKEGVYDVMGNENKEPKEYVLTKDDVESDYNEISAKNSFDENPFEEEEF